MGYRARLWVEFIVLFGFFPLTLFFTSGDYVILGICAWSVLGGLLLSRTKGFEWRSLMNWPKARDLWRLAFMALMVLIISVLGTLYMFPERLFSLPREFPVFWVMLIVLYPILSALPQEIVFRALYFERYAEILPKSYPMVLNALVFMFAHIAYGAPIVMAMTFAGGLLFARAHLRGEFPMAVLLHAVAGNMIFTSGLGWVFCASCGN